jgi:phosphoglycolate phosphatase-like HAD superfamily hydrolase
LDFQNYDTIIFDLDDTLYPEIEYLKPAFKAISEAFEGKYAVNALEVEHFLVTTFEQEGRQMLFKKCFCHFVNKEDEGNNEAENEQNTEGAYFYDMPIGQYLEILRTVKIAEKIALFPYVYALIPQLVAEKKQIFVLTNGNPKQQRNKIAHLDWQNLDTYITFVFANEFAPKPSPRVFSDFLEPNFYLKTNKALFIGDAETDAEFSQNVGFDFLHVSDYIATIQND